MAGSMHMLICLTQIWSNLRRHHHNQNAWMLAWHERSYQLAVASSQSAVEIRRRTINVIHNIPRVRLMPVMTVLPRLYNFCYKVHCYTCNPVRVKDFANVRGWRVWLAWPEPVVGCSTQVNLCRRDTCIPPSTLSTLMRYILLLLFSEVLMIIQILRCKTLQSKFLKIIW